MKKLLYLAITLLLTYHSFAQNNNSNFKVSHDVIYGQGPVVTNGKNEFFDLKLDVYEPVGESTGKRPVIIYTHGGAFHRGNPRQTYHELGAQDTSPKDYCEKFASMGYVCFAISYRMATQNPIPSYEGYTKEDLNMERLNVLLDQANVVRKGMNLQPLDLTQKEDKEFMSYAVLAAAEDLRTAISYVRNNAETYNADSNKIVLGGFSAGAVTTLNVAYGMKIPVSGIFLLSGLDIGFDIPKLINANDPPILMFLGQYDLAGAISEAPKFLEDLQSNNIDYSFAWVAGFGHFYSQGAVSLSGDGKRMSVGDRIIEFLQKLD